MSSNDAVGIPGTAGAIVFVNRYGRIIGFDDIRDEGADFFEGVH